ncbi:MAG: LPS export ABC transporter periplasmic protein LptC [Gammaproteobacteria bacterium]
MNTLRYLVIFVTVLILASLSGWWLSELRKRPAPLPPPDARHYDYYLTNFHSTVLDAAGKPAYRIRAAHLEHYPHDDRATLRQPHFTLLEADATWEAQAEQGVVFLEQQTLDMSGAVILTQTSAGGPEVTLHTEQLHIDAQEKTLTSTVEVKIASGRDTIEAIGLKANLANGQLELLSHVQGRYHVTPR